jgi:hypothetical protein
LPGEAGARYVLPRGDRRWYLHIYGGTVMTLSTACFPRLALPLAGLLLSLLVASAPAAAQGMSAEQACTPDVFRLCSEHIPDRGRITACLHAKRRALGPDCRRVFADAKPARAAKTKKKKARRRG